jgi:hypothetical protein
MWPTAEETGWPCAVVYTSDVSKFPAFLPHILDNLDVLGLLSVRSHPATN